MIGFKQGMLLGFLLGLAGLVSAGDSVSGGYKVIQKVPLQGEGGWDYLKLDDQARRLYITHDTQVLVLDADTYKQIASIDGLHRVHGVALAAELGRGFITSGDSGTVVVFDLKTFKKISEVKAQKGADAVVYDPATGRVFTFNGDSENSTVIEASTGKIIQTFSLGGKPEFAAVDGQGHVFNNLEDKSLVLKIDTKTLKITDRWPLAPGESPSGLAMDTKNNRLFVGCRNRNLAVMDAVSGKVIQTLKIGEHVDATYFDPASATVFNSCGDGTLSVVHEDTPNQFSLVENAATALGARTMAYDAKTDHVFLPAAQMQPPATPTKEDPKPRRKMIPGTFTLLVLGR